MDFADDLTDFLEYITVERGLSRKTAEAYGRDLRQLMDFLKSIGITDWHKVECDHLLDFLNTLLDKGEESTTIARHLVSTKVLFRHLLDEGRIQKDVTMLLDSPKLWQVLPDFLSEAEVDRFLAAFPASVQIDILDLRNRTILELLYSSGLRVSELTNLPLSGIDFDNETCRVVGKGKKTRVIPIGKIALQLLRRYIGEVRPELLKNPNTAWVFLSQRGKKLNRERVWAIVKEAAERAGITKNIHPHTLRHSFASHLLAHGADLRVIQEMLGHSSITTTEVYTHVDQNRFSTLHRQFHPRG